MHNVHFLRRREFEDKNEGNRADKPLADGRIELLLSIDESKGDRLLH